VHMRTTNNTILIVGGTSGIGRALAETFFTRGNKVIIAGRRQTLLDEIANCHPGIYSVRLDVQDAASVARAAEEVRSRFPELNVLIANAGISRSEDMKSDDWDTSVAEQVVQTNILGVLRVVSAFLPQLKAKRDAAIMATSSALAFVPRADFPTYCASKAFLHSWLQSLRHQLKHFPVEVLELSPPYVQSELTGPQQASDPRAMPLPEFVAEVLRILESADHSRGEILLPRDLPRRWAERDGRYDEIFAAQNPS